MKKLGYTVFALSLVTAGLSQSMNLAVADTALTPGQASQFQGFLQSQTDWTNVIANELQKSAGTQVLVPGTGTAQPVNQGTLEQDCNVSIVPPSQKGVLSVGSTADNDQTQIPMFTVTIDGAGCPVQINASIDGQQTANSFHAIFTVKMTVLDSTFAQQNDVDSESMTMDITATLTQTGTNAADVQVGLVLSGQAHSTSLGNVVESASINSTMDITPPAQGQFFPGLTMKLGEELKYQFSGFNADLQSSVDLEGLMGPMTATYAVNGVQVSQQDYQTYLNSISLPLTQNPGSTPPPASTGMTCEVRVYAADQVSKQALLDSISNQTPIAAIPLLDDSKTSSASWQVAGSGVQAQIDFESQLITLTVSTPSDGQSNELTVLTGQNGDVADQVGNYTFRLTCSAGAQ